MILTLYVASSLDTWYYSECPAFLDLPSRVSKLSYSRKLEHQSNYVSHV